LHRMRGGREFWRQSCRGSAGADFGYTRVKFWGGGTARIQNAAKSEKRLWTQRFYGDFVGSERCYIFLPYGPLELQRVIHPRDISVLCSTPELQLLQHTHTKLFSLRILKVTPGMRYMIQFSLYPSFYATVRRYSILQTHPSSISNRHNAESPPDIPTSYYHIRAQKYSWCLSGVPYRPLTPYSTNSKRG
jgi:hypothetical protein